MVSNKKTVKKTNKLKKTYKTIKRINLEINTTHKKIKDNHVIKDTKNTKDTKNNIDNKNIEYFVAIPTYKRYQIIQDKTLKVLRNAKIPKERIYLFVADKNEYQEYKRNVPKEMYHKIVIGVLGLKNQRNFITKYFPEGTNIVNLDDDISEISQLYKIIPPLSGKKTNINYRLQKLKHLDYFLQQAFKICKENDAYLWGVNPVYNPYFMNFRTYTDLKFMVGTMWGCINRHTPDLTITINEKEDVERTLQYYKKDGIIIRFNYITIKTKYYKTPGGMQSEDKNRRSEALDSATYLNNLYPKYTSLYFKKNGHPELRLKDKTI